MTRERLMLGFLTLGVLVLDIVSPRGMNVAVLYAPLLVLASVFIEETAHLIFVVIVFAVLAAVDIVLSKPGAPLIYTVVNRVLLLHALALILISLLRYHRVQNGDAKHDVLTENRLLAEGELLIRDVYVLRTSAVVTLGLALGGLALIFRHMSFTQEWIRNTVFTDLLEVNTVLVGGFCLLLILSLLARVCVSVARFALHRTGLGTSLLEVFVWVTVNVSVYMIALSSWVIIANMIGVVSEDAALVIKVVTFVSVSLFEMNTLGRFGFGSQKRYLGALLRMRTGASVVRLLLKQEIEEALDEMTGEEKNKRGGDKP